MKLYKWVRGLFSSSFEAAAREIAEESLSAIKATEPTTEEIEAFARRIAANEARLLSENLENLSAADRLHILGAAVRDRRLSGGEVIRYQGEARPIGQFIEGSVMVNPRGEEVGMVYFNENPFASDDAIADSTPQIAPMPVKRIRKFDV